MQLSPPFSTSVTKTSDWFCWYQVMKPAVNVIVIAKLYKHVWVDLTDIHHKIWRYKHEWGQKGIFSYRHMLKKTNYICVSYFCFWIFSNIQLFQYQKLKSIQIPGPYNPFSFLNLFLSNSVYIWKTCQIQIFFCPSPNLKITVSVSIQLP